MRTYNYPRVENDSALRHAMQLFGDDKRRP
jgi:hypothetical protein